MRCVNEKVKKAAAVKYEKGYDVPIVTAAGMGILQIKFC